MDTEPLRLLYRKYQNEIYLYLYSLCHNRELAENQEHLPGRQREILLLHYFSGLSLKEISVILKQTPENLRIQAYRGKATGLPYMTPTI